MAARVRYQYAFKALAAACLDADLVPGRREMACNLFIDTMDVLLLVFMLVACGIHVQ